MTSDAVHLPVSAATPEEPPADRPSVVLARTGRGWSVLSPGRADDVADLLEGLSLADLVTEELDGPADPDRATRRAARGATGAGPDGDPRDARIAALERTVAQLEHALASRVATERAIGVLAERQGTSPRAAFEALRTQARSLGRPVHELAREVLEPLDGAAAEAAAALPPTPRRPPGRRVPHAPGRPGPAVPADGRR
ncbi:ANTAR domain-containing protein [Geodermatophilus sp. SYSU D01036]